jgi:hypothetical protein
LRQRAELLFTIAHGKDVALSDGLALLDAANAGSGDQMRADTGPHIIDLEFGRDTIALESNAAGERDSVVGKIADDTAMRKSMPLLMMIHDFQTGLDDSIFSRNEIFPNTFIKWLLRKY